MGAAIGCRAAWELASAWNFFDPQDFNDAVDATSFDEDKEAADLMGLMK